MIPGSLLVTVAPLVMAAVVYLLRRREMAVAFLASATSAVLAWVCWQLPLDGTSLVLGRPVDLGASLQVVGRELVITPTTRPALALLFAIAALLFLCAGTISPGRSFFPLGLVTLVFLSAPTSGLRMLKRHRLHCCPYILFETKQNCCSVFFDVGKY